MNKRKNKYANIFEDDNKNDTNTVVYEKKNRSITKEDCVSILDDYKKNNIVTREWNGYDIAINRVLDVASVKSFVRGVVDACFNEDGEYMPENFDIALEASVVAYYSDVELPDGVDAYEFLNMTGIADFMYDEIDMIQLAYIRSAARKKVDELVETSSREVHAAITKIVNAVNSLDKSLAEMFSNVTADDIAKMISAIGDGGIDEEKLMKAYIDNLGSAEQSE